MEFLSFIGTKIVKAGSGLANEVAKAIHKRKKGLNFLLLWGKGRALRLRSVTTGQQFGQHAYLVKPQ